MEFLNDIAPRFAPEKYNLFTNNCNNFSNECAMFLTGSGIPSHIVNLPNEVLATPLGRQLLQMMGGAGGNMMDPRTFEGTHNTQQMHLNYGPGNHELPPQTPQGGVDSLTGNLTGSNQSAPTPSISGGVKPVTELLTQQDYLREIQANPAVVVDVFTEWCGPCKAIKPFFATLPAQYPQIRFFKVKVFHNRWTLIKTDSWEQISESNRSLHFCLFTTDKWLKR